MKGGKIKVAATLLIVVSGAAAAVFLSKPGFHGVDNRFGAVTPSETPVHTTVTFSNPNPVSVALGDLHLEYRLAMNGISMAEGGRNGLNITEGNNTVDLTTFITNENIPEWWASHVANSETTTVEITPRLSYGGFDLTKHLGRPSVTRDVQTQILDRLQISEPQPVTYQGQDLLILRKITSRWGSVEHGQTRITTDITVYNPRATPVPLSQLQYEAALNNISLANGVSRDVAVIPPREEKTVTVDTELNNEKLDEWWVTHLQNNEFTRLQLRFDAVADLETTTVSFTLCRYRHGFYTDFLDSYRNRTGSSTVSCMENLRETGDGDGLGGTGDGLDDTVNDTTGSDSGGGENDSVGGGLLG